MKKVRNSNIEFARILSILFIIIHHYTVHNGVFNESLSLGINRFFLENITLGNIGSVLFVIISGYYLVNNKNGVKLSKLLKLWLQIFFYSVIIYLVFVFTGLEPFSKRAFIRALFPITFEEYWFATAYIVLYIFHPFINKLINTLNRKEHLSLILLGLIVFSIPYVLTTKTLYANELVEFIMYYIIGAYFGKYNHTIFNNKKINYITIISSIIILTLSVVLLDFAGTKLDIYPFFSIYLFTRISIVTIMISISIFNIFANRPCICNKKINTISACVFGIYLIHDNNYVRNLLWIKVFKNANYVYSNYLVLHMIISVLIVFILCLVIEFLRKKIFDSIYDKYIINSINNVQAKILKSFNTIYGKINHEKNI